jgi:hypothetical protein
MAHYAFLDEDNFVIDVIVGIDETELIEGKEPEVWYSEFRNQVCKRTSYNGKIRKNYAGIGYFYDETLDAFIPPKPFNSWVLDKKKAQWKPPVAQPADGFTYFWNEELVDWELSNFSEVEE